jgi:hypothetical protein
VTYTISPDGFTPKPCQKRFKGELKIFEYYRSDFFNNILKSLASSGNVFLHDNCARIHDHSDIINHVKHTCLEDLGVNFGRENSPNTLKHLSRSVIIKNTRAHDWVDGFLNYSIPVSLQNYLLFLDI